MSEKGNGCLNLEAQVATGTLDACFIAKVKYDSVPTAHIYYNKRGVRDWCF